METITDAQIQTIIAKANKDATANPNPCYSVPTPDAELMRQCQDALNGDDAARTALAALLPVFVNHH